MTLELPLIPAGERTPLVDALLSIIHAQHQRIQVLEEEIQKLGDASRQRIQVLEEEVQKLRDEIALLKGQKPRPTITPSRLETPPPKPPPADGEKRPGSPKRSKKDVFLNPETVILPFPDRPPGARSNGYEEYFVQ